MLHYAMLESRSTATILVKRRWFYFLERLRTVAVTYKAFKRCVVYAFCNLSFNALFLAITRQIARNMRRVTPP